MNIGSDFQQLLRDCRVQTEYEDVNGQVQRASCETLLAVLRSLGVEIDRPEQAAAALAARQSARLARGVAPVLVAWDGHLEPIAVALPAGATGVIAYEIIGETDRRAGEFRTDDLAPLETPAAAGLGYRRLSVPPPTTRLPPGYHQLRLAACGRSFESLIISSPSQVYGAAGQLPAAARDWGVFLPLHALRHERDWGVGDFTALGRLAEWTGRLGGAAVGTLPLLAASIDEPFEPSPYRPLSREFWNELFVDVEAVAELAACPECRRIIEETDFRRQLQDARAANLVDYRLAMRAKRQALSTLAEYFFREKPARFAEFRQFRDEHPQLESYARFRAAVDARRTDWLQWPRALQSEIRDGDFNIADMRYHQYAQWIAQEQLQSLQRQAEAAGCGLYLDLPVGVDPGGFDAWSHQQQFAPGVTTGAPPDPFFTRGQDWGLPPLHPERLRESGYAMLRQALATSMRYARRLRIDHVMGWHRLYWIAAGAPADQGTYVGYEADEFYAVAMLESHRWRCTLLAENLGTVPAELDERMQRHGIGGMWVAPYELEASRRETQSAPSPQSVASLNTHDMPMLAAWWRGDDIADRQDLGLLSEPEAQAERADRRETVATLSERLRRAGVLPLAEEGGQEPPMAALLRFLAASEAQLVMVNLEDMWFETLPQNVPGTSSERPNWRRRARHTLAEFTHMPQVVEALSMLNALRRRSTE